MSLDFYQFLIFRRNGPTQAQTTLRYAHLYDDPLRAGLDQVGDALRPKLRLVQTESTSENAA